MKPLGARAIENAREQRGEIVDLTTREVWQDRDPTPRDWWDALELEAPLVKVGRGAGSMDRMWFRRSPDADVDGPVREREIAGRPFFYCARAPADMGQGNPRRMLVDKHHTLVYAAGRDVQILTTAEGRDFVRVVDGVPGAPAPELPDGWSLRDIHLSDDWIVALPAPAETWWFEGLISYQGPIDDVPGD